MKLIVTIMFGFLLIPALALSQEVTIASDSGANVNLTLDQAAQNIYAKAKAELGDDILQIMIEDWIKYHERRYEKNDMVKMSDRLKALSMADKQKIMDQIAACAAGPC